MSVELAAEWLPLFVAAEQLNASHPLRESAFEQAETAVCDSYLDQADTDLPDAEFKVEQDRLQDIAADVVEVLRGVAVLIATDS
jgi:hypothetical protein